MHAQAATMLLLLAVAPMASAEVPLEIDILEAYLAGHDRVAGVPHCARHDGHAMTPDGPMATPAYTNGILREHKQWHIDHGGPGRLPSPDESDRFGDHFVYWHRDFLGAYEAWRAETGHPPVPAWDPGTPQPDNLRYEFPGRGCTPGKDRDPQVPLPSWATQQGGLDKDPVFGHTHLCAFQDVNQFGKAIGSQYHARVHQAMGGDMSVQQGPRDPAFWAFHRYLDDHVLHFEQTCLAPADDEAVAPLATPAPGAAPLLALGLLAFLWRGRRSS